jgi:RHS repeat-associated protein
VTTIRPDGHITQWLTYGSGHVHGLLIDGHDVLGFERDDLHREIVREQGNGLTQKQHYDPAGRLLEQQISQTKPGAIEAVGIRRSYAYDKAGQLIAIGDSRRGNLSYRYDPVGRLLEANSRLGRETFAFDPAGNIGNPSSDTEGGAQAAGRITNRVAVRLDGDGRSMAGRLMDNLLKDYAGTHYKWDERGNLIERSRNGEKTVFTWDGYNRMRSAETFGETTSFSYDPLGRRIAKRTSRATTLFGWDGDTLAFESTQGAEAQQEEQAWRGDSVHYIHEPGSFVPLMQIRQAQAVALSETTDVKALIADNGGRYDIEQDPLWNGEQSRTPAPFGKEEIAFYQCDHLGTPQELTDHEGRVAWSASYKAWGEARQVISESGRKAGFRNPIRFQGQYWDDETGLHYNRYRYYDPHVGRFTSRDPIGLQGGINLHEYAVNSTGWIDPKGLARGQPKTESAGRKPKTGKPNIDNRCTSCKKWAIGRFDKICEGHIPGVGTAKFFRDPKDGSWYSVDQTGHGGSAFKQFDQKGNVLNHAYDLDEFGDRMGKHKGNAGKVIDLKSLKCKNGNS